jgi:hypothetical protein
MDIVYHIKHKNMINHYNSLKNINIENEELKTIIETDKNIKNKETNKNMPVPSEIKNHYDKKPWIRIPYPIREIKLIEYTEKKEYNQELKDKYLKLLYEKKLTSKVVTYNQLTGQIDDIVISE